MKKTLVIATMLVMLISLFSIQSFAADPAMVYVTISNGTLVMTQEAIAVTDTDGDGSLTINDALYLAHEAKYKGGAAAGYASAEGQYGLGLTKLWGIENGGSYGYYVNNTSAMGLTDAVKDGDYINAFVYTDTTAFSDAYCFFDVNTVSAVKGTDQTVSLTLSAAGYDENWNPVVKPVEGAVILVDGKESSFVTDTNGKVTLELDINGNSVISAKSTAVTLVPPVCVVTAGEVVTSPQTEDTTIFYAVAGISALAIAFVLLKRKKAYEK